MQRGAQAGLLLLAAAAPWCEAGALDAAASQLAARGATVAAWDVDVGGLHLLGVEAVVGTRALAADRIDIGSDGRTIAVAVHALEVRGRDDHDAPATTAAAPSEDPTAAAAEAAVDPWHVPNGGVPLEIRVVDPLALALPRGAELRLDDTVLTVDRAGWPSLRASGQIEGPAELAATLEHLDVRRSDGAWLLEAAFTPAGGNALTASGRVDDERLAVTLQDPSAQQHLAITLHRDNGDVELAAQSFPLAALGLAPRLARLQAGHRLQLALADATLDGALELTTQAPIRAHAEALVIAGVGIDDRRLAPSEVRLGPLTIDGDLAFDGEGGGSAQLWLAHGDARLATAASLEGRNVEVDVDLAELPCQALLDSLPRGLGDALVGARLSGNIDARLDFSLSLDALAATDTDDVSAPPPGTLSLAFPFLERCRTTTDPSGVDLQALRGPYRHRFATDEGRTIDRVLAAGAPGYVPLSRVPRIAAAFIALEDTGFWYHDGFDREQIERAFWHNVVSGRVRRGASTISQQTARNLWLGVDRSLARKLQEAYLTARLESAVGKARILELYLNLIELGPGVYGIDAAARHHFGVAADELNPLQAVHLASLAPAPNGLSRRFASGEVDDAWLDGLRHHLRRMHRKRMISAAELARGLHAELGLVRHDRDG